MTDGFRHYRWWFYAAALYNAVWGSAVVLFPGTLLRMAEMNATGALPLVQVMGMMVGVFAYGYYLLARDPKRYCGFIWIALAGKTFGPLGLVPMSAVPMEPNSLPSRARLGGDLSLKSFERRRRASAPKRCSRATFSSSARRASNFATLAAWRAWPCPAAAGSCGRSPNAP